MAASPQANQPQRNVTTRSDSRAKGNQYTLGKHAEDVYQAESGRRDNVRDRAREVAHVTIPSLIPPDGWKEGDPLYTPYQSIGARGVNNISSRLLLTLMPPERPLFSHEVPEKLAQDMKQRDEDAYGKIVLALSKRALRVTSRADTTPLRATLYETFRLLVVGGNGLLQYDDIDSPVIHGIHRYIVKRDNRGNPLLTILKEEVGWASLPETIQAAINDKNNTDYEEIRSKDEWERSVPVYTVCKLVGYGKKTKRWVSWQESCKKVIPGSEGAYPFDAPPQYPLWMIPNYGGDWGRGYAEEYIGDLISVDNLAKSIGDAAALAALALIFVAPGSSTRKTSIEKAKNLDVVVGKAADVSVFRSEKQSDMAFVNQTMDKTIERLAYAFLLNSAIQRNAERVTAEEIRLMARELDETMGGIYSIFAGTLQRYIVNRLIYVMEKTGELPKVPQQEGYDPLRMKIVTGIDSLGNSREVEILDEFMEPILKIPEAMAKVNLDDYLRRKAAGLGINPDGLIKSSDQQAQDQQNMESTAARQTLMSKGVGPAITAMGQAGTAMLNNGQVGSAQNPADLSQLDPKQIAAMLQAVSSGQMPGATPQQR